MPEDFIPEGVEGELPGSIRRSTDLAAAQALQDAQRTLDGSAKAASFLSSNKELLDLEISHFHEERQIVRRAARLKTVSDVFRIFTQLAFAIIGVAIAAALTAMWWTALTSKAVVVDPFDSPASMSSSGLTGTVVAGKVLDELLRIRDNTKFSAAQQQIHDAWSNSIEVKLPEAGISLDQINNALHRTFGHDTHIDGALITTSRGTLQLSVRGDGIPPTTFEGGTDEIDDLARKAAEYTYGYAQPTLYSIYLIASGREGDGIAFIRTAFPRASDEDRPALASLWGEALFIQGKVSEAGERFRFALNIDPHNWRAWNNLIGILPQTVGEEAAYRSGLDMKKAAQGLSSKSGPSLFDQTNFAQLTLDPAAVIAGLMADRHLAQHEGAVYDASTWIAEQEAVRHDWGAVYVFLAESPQADPTTAFDVEVMPGLHAMETGDHDKAISHLEAADKLWRTSPLLLAFFADFECTLGHAYAEAGQIDKAMPLLGDRRFVRCRAFLADALDRSGQWEAAKTSYRAAEAAAPHLSFAYYREALALVRHGLTAEALRRLEITRQLSPHWADPQKAIGDLFAGETKWDKALNAYNEALRWAPAWPALLQAKARAAEKLHSQ
jgi:tetratricopeptide (TPR) repeat protein